MKKSTVEPLFHSPFAWQSAVESYPELAMHRLFRLLQQRNRYVHREPTTNLSLLDAHILTELDAFPGITQTELLKILEVSQTSLSLVCAELEQQGLLTRERHAQDKRIVKYALTKQGKKIVDESDIVTDNTFAKFGKLISQKERDELVAFFKTLSDGTGQLPGKLRAGETTFRLQQRRLTRALGLLHSQVFGSAFSVTEWQVLAEIGLYSGAIFAKDIEQRLGIPASTLTFILRRLEKVPYVERQSFETDTRKKVLLITAAGQKALNEIESNAAKRIQKGLQNVSAQKKKQWLKILASYSLGELADTNNIADTITFHIALTPEQKTLIRSYLITQNVTEGTVSFLPATIAGVQQLTVYGQNKGKVCVALDLESIQGTWEITASASNKPQYVKDLLKWLVESPQGPRHSTTPATKFPPLLKIL